MSRGYWTQAKIAFVQAYLETGNGVQAARAAGYANAKGASYHLLHHDHQVREAIQVARADERARASVTVVGLIEQLERDHAFAREHGDAMAAVTATATKAAIAGHAHAPAPAHEAPWAKLNLPADVVPSAGLGVPSPNVTGTDAPRANSGTPTPTNTTNSAGHPRPAQTAATADPIDGEDLWDD